MKKIMMAVAAVVMTLAVTGCDDNTERCWKITKEVKDGLTGKVTTTEVYWTMTEDQVEDACEDGTVIDAGDMGYVKMNYKRVSSKNCE